MSMTLIIQFLVLTAVVSGVLIFFLKKILFDSTQGAVNRLNRETEEVRAKQTELNDKIKEANEELIKRRSEADELMAKMKEDAETKAREERDKIMKKAREDGEDIINKAQQTKDEIRRVLEKEMHIKAVDLSLILLDEVLSERAKGAFNENMINEFFEKLESVNVDIVDENVNTVDITTAIPLTDELKKNLKAIVKKRLERDVEINETNDEGLINGILLKFGNLSLDGSLKTLLKETAADVKERLDQGILKLKD